MPMAPPSVSPPAGSRDTGGYFVRVALFPGLQIIWWEPRASTTEPIPIYLWHGPGARPSATPPGEDMEVYFRRRPCGGVAEGRGGTPKGRDACRPLPIYDDGWKRMDRDNDDNDS